MRRAAHPWAFAAPAAFIVSNMLVLSGCIEQPGAGIEPWDESCSVQQMDPETEVVQNHGCHHYIEDRDDEYRCHCAIFDNPSEAYELRLGEGSELRSSPVERVRCAFGV